MMMADEEYAPMMDAEEWAPMMEPEAREDSDGLPKYLNFNSDAQQADQVKSYYGVGACFMVFWGSILVVAQTVIRP